jgi:hypothetical protein
MRQAFPQRPPRITPTLASGRTHRRSVGGERRVTSRLTISPRSAFFSLLNRQRCRSLITWTANAGSITLRTVPATLGWKNVGVVPAGRRFHFVDWRLATRPIASFGERWATGRVYP